MNLSQRLIWDVDAQKTNRHAPFIIAEAGVNHEGSIDTAKRLIDEAKEGGADAIKFQSYKAETLACKESPSYWDTSQEKSRSQYELFKRYDKFWKSEFEELSEYCKKAEIEFLSTPFDKESADFLAELVSTFKISSSDITNKPFIDHICSYKKPVLISVGASFLWEIDRAVHWLVEGGVNYALMHCVLNYPTLNVNANLRGIQTLKERYPRICIGYSDHTLPGDMRIMEYASLMGATIIEKHFTHDKNLPGNDHYHAMDKDDLKRFRKRCGEMLDILGAGNIDPRKDQQSARINARRSLVTSRMIKRGQVIMDEDLISKRPSTGIAPFEIERVIGMRASEDIPDDTILSWSMIVK